MAQPSVLTLGRSVTRWGEWVLVLEVWGTQDHGPRGISGIPCPGSLEPTAQAGAVAPNPETSPDDRDISDSS